MYSVSGEFFSLAGAYRYLETLGLYYSTWHIYVLDYNNGVTPRVRRDPKFCEASPQILRGVTQNFHLILRGVTPNFARRHPKFCEASPQILRGVTPNFARRHPKFCEASPQILRGVTSNFQFCEASLQIL